MHLSGGRLREFAQGCDVLGGGGGGPAGDSLPLALHAVDLNGPVEVVDLAELPEDGLVMPCAFLGAPAIGAERIGTCRESVAIRRHVEHHFGKPVVAMLCTEIGGYNGPAAAALASHAGLPLLDGDGMGRAFPGVDQVAMQLAGVTPGPSVLADEHDRVVTVHAEDGAWLERLARTVVTGFGDRGVSSEYVMTAQQARADGAVVLGSVRKALRIGELLAQPGSVVRRVRALAGEFDGRVVAEGRISAVLPATGPDAEVLATNRRTPAMLEGIGPDRGRTLRLEVGHEYLAVIEDGEPLATMPDIITLFDTYTGQPVSAERLRYGLRVVVLALPCPPLWRTEDGLALVGPGAFGLDLPYRPLEVS
ncbi:DUF917 domain-containing protein [Kutzneria viridogrisea]|uniref:DUF917 domain-containing protein n=2 Tax=Kutzneria TaxID=43356 RepID=W5WGW5_9PSEU|nr:DUF917 domain-containing protein [Kutzneria albida]AHH99990.1 hypothetical protein KALB_6631 [Kutzneria albida DSM 43870]MBA8925170.1 hypothetical protein [Kutzneria viridogrisea]